jgi:peptidoglycan hydrolase-like protein with peptidoglycan-binding domain
MADDQNEKPQVVRSPEPGVEAAREAEERRRVAEIAREFEELGRALKGRDRVARFDTAERAESSPAQAGKSAGGVGDRSTPEPEPLPTVSDMSSAPKEVSPQVGKFATIPAIPQQRKPVAEGGPPTRRRKWGPSLAAAVIVLSLVSGGAFMLMGPPIEIAQDAYRRAEAEMQRLTAQGIEIAQDAYRSAVAEMQRLTARENAETEAAARKAAEEKALAEEAERKAAEGELAAVAAARRHEEEARQAAEEKARAEAAREMAEAQARAAAQEAAKRQAAEDARLKAEEVARKAAEGKPKSDAKVGEQAERAEAGLKLSEQDRKRVQVALNSLGHEIPTATGYFGPRTRAMITAWQKTQGLPETGYLTEAQLATLRQQAAAASAKYDQAQPKVKEDPRGIEILTATARTAASEAAQAKETAGGSATAEKALQEERTRADALARDLDAAQRKVEALTAAISTASGETTRVREDAMHAAQELQRSQQQERERADAFRREVETAERAAAELRHELQEERSRAEKLARELAAAGHELETQAKMLAKTRTTQNQELTELRQALQQAQTAAAAYQESLAQERVRNQQLAQEAAARRDATPDRGRTALPSPSDTPSTATDKAATAPPPKADKPPLPVGAKPATIVPPPTPPEVPGNPEAARLMARARLLVSQGNIGAARVVLDRAVETGSASALFALAETYDPVVLSALGTVGTQADVTKARELYGKALAGGVHEAQDRLNALPQ